MLNYLLKEKDNIEKIRDQIGFILTAELKNQYSLALEYTPAADEFFDPNDFNIDVYIENKRPWEIAELPIINILIIGTKPPEDGTKRGSPIGKQNYTNVFQIDCYAKGRHIDGGDDDLDASNRAWITGRLARSILMSEENAYLGLRGIVGKRMVTARNIVDITDLPKSAEDISLCRVILEVETFEESPKGEYKILEGLSFKISTLDGKIIMAEVKTPPYEEEK
jgi:hypothetical protein